MADLSVTVAEVQITTNTQRINGTAGATITAGQLLYLDVSAGTYKLAQCDGTAEEATVAGLALHASLAGQPINMQVTGNFTVGATAAMTVGENYWASDVAGSIQPDADVITSTWYRSYIGTASAAGVLKLNIQNTGVQIP